MDKQKCREIYSYLEASRDASSGSIWLTLCVILLTVCAEFAANIDWNCGESKQTKCDEEHGTQPAGIASSSPPVELSSLQPQSHPQPDIQTQPASEANQGSTTTPTESQTPACVGKTPRTVRANRLSATAVVYIGVLAAFISLIRLETVRHIELDCLSFIHPSPPHLGVIIPSSIAFACATVAFLRTIVDCVLMRWGKGLSQDASDKYTWYPLMPLFGVVFAIAFVFVIVLEALKVPAACLMGDWNVSTFWASMSKDKGKQAMVENADELQERESERLPTYDEVDVESGPAREGEEKVPLLT